MNGMVARWTALGSAVLLMGAVWWSADAPVADAAERSDLEAVRELVRQGADVNAAQGDGMTALHWAANHDDVDMVQLLLYAGAHVESRTRLGGYTPLHLAASQGLEDVTAALLEGGGNPATLTRTGVQALHLAAESGDVATVQTLLQAGANVNAPETFQERTPLMFASAFGRVAVMDLLIEADAEIGAATRVVDYVERSEVDRAERRKRAAMMAAARGEDPESAANAPLGPYGRRGATPDTTQADTTAMPDTAAAEPAEEPTEPEEPHADEPPPEKPTEPEATDPPPPTDPDQPTTPEEEPEEPEEPEETEQKKQAIPDSAQVFPSALSYTDLVGKQGGFSALHYAARDGHIDAAIRLLDAGADVNQVTGGDQSSPLLVAVINGNYDLAMMLLERGADPNLVSEDGAGPLFAVVNGRWALRTWYPQPTAWQQQETTYLDMMRALLQAGAEPNARVNTHIWYTAYNAGRMGVDFSGATPFWRAAYSLDVDGMRLLHEFGADPNIPTTKPAQRRRPGADEDEEEEEDPSGLPEVPVGGPAVHPLHAASGVGYGTSRVGQQHVTVPDGWLPAVKFLVEEMGVDVNVRDHDGYSAVHNAAARGDNEVIEYLVSQGADVTFVSRRGQTTVDMANGPQQRVQPFPETIALLEGLGAENNNNCISC